MITRETVKREIDHVREDHLELLYKIIKAFEAEPVRQERKEPVKSWTEFVEETYGSMADHPISRGEQGIFEIREEF